MRELRNVIAANISELRQQKNMTQLMLADRLNYSDKAVSKWERGESLPDIEVMKSIADLFEVSVDYLLSEDHTQTINRRASISRTKRRNRILISFLAVMIVWLTASVIFVILGLVTPTSHFQSWLVFLYAAPISCVVNLIFNSIWGRPKLNYLIVSVMIWAVLVSVHTTFLMLTDFNIWIIYIIGIPGQIIILLWAGINKTESERPIAKKRRERKNES